MPVTIKTPNEAFRCLHEALRYTGENREQVMARKSVKFLREYVAELTGAALAPVVETVDEPPKLFEGETKTGVLDTGHVSPEAT